MSHWAEPHIDSVREAIVNTGWVLEDLSSDTGPLQFTHDDGSELSVSDSRNRTGTVAVQYTPAEGVTAGFNLNKSGGWQGRDYTHEAFSSIENAIDLAEHILTRHEEEN